MYGNYIGITLVGDMLMFFSLMKNEKKNTNEKCVTV